MARPRWYCCCLPGCLLLGAAPFLVFGVFLKLGSSRPDTAAPRKTYTPTEVKQARSHVKQLENQIRSVGQAAEQGKKKPFHFVLTEKDLNAYLTSDPELGEKLKQQGFKDMRVTMKGGNVGFEGRVPFPPEKPRLHLWIHAEGPLRAGEKGKLLFEPEKIELGRLKWNLPQSTREQIAERIRSDTNGAILQLPGEIKSLRVTDGKVVIKGVTDPALVKELKGQYDTLWRRHSGSDADQKGG